MEEKDKEKKDLILKLFETVENFGLWILDKIHLKIISNFYREHLEGMRYLVCGALATVVNIAVYAVFFYLCNLDNALSNIIAWIVAAIFAYITNKFIVFDSKVDSNKKLLREIVSFFGCRLFTLVVDEAIMIITVDKFGLNGVLMKVVANIVVIILNFILSKLIIFKKDEK